MATTSYAVALGSNRRHGRHGAPAEVLRAAIAAMMESGLIVESVSRVRSTPAMGPAGRGFANAALLLTTALAPFELIDILKFIERNFGRRGGRRWGPRVLDIDIILWSEGAWQSPGLMIPHPAFRERAFVLDPLAEIAPDWRDPIGGGTIRQLLHRSRKRSPVDPDATLS